MAQAETELTMLPEEAAERAVAVREFEPLAGVGNIDFRTMANLAKTLFDSGLVPHSHTKWQTTFAVILQGQELGFGPMLSLNNIYVVKGKTQLSAFAALSLVHSALGPTALTVDDYDDEHATVSYVREGWPERRTFTYTIEHARRAGLLPTSDDADVPWNKYREEMLRWKAIRRVVDIAFADVKGGLQLADADVSADFQPGELEDQRVTMLRQRFFGLVAGTYLAEDPDRRHQFLKNATWSGIDSLAAWLPKASDEEVEQVFKLAADEAEWDRKKQAEEDRLRRKLAAEEADHRAGQLRAKLDLAGRSQPE